MKYIMLMYADEKAGAALAGGRTIHQRMSALLSGKPEPGAPPRDEMDAWLEQVVAYSREMKQAGVLVQSEGLHPTSAAATVRVQKGKPATTHGPFAETKEQLGGFYVLECKNLDEAIEWAGKAPQAKFGSVEVRPLWVPVLS